MELHMILLPLSVTARFNNVFGSKKLNSCSHGETSSTSRINVDSLENGQQSSLCSHRPAYQGASTLSPKRHAKDALSKLQSLPSMSLPFAPLAPTSLVCSFLWISSYCFPCLIARCCSLSLALYLKPGVSPWPGRNIGTGSSRSSS
jgi:hypothetical protein